jgi:hypothetical protein
MGRFSISFRSKLAGVSVVALTCLVALPAASNAAPISLSDLAPGAHYRLIFETQTMTDATSTAVSTYNTIVQNEASAAGLGTNWSAIVSSDTVNAIDNIACTPSCSNDPIFLVTGSEVAASTTDLFSGALLTAIDVAANGSSLNPNGYIWTGTNSSGTEASFTSGTTTYFGVGDSAVELGGSVFGSTFGIDSGSQFSNTALASLFGISGDLVVPAPEPISASLLAIGALATGVARRRRRMPSTGV